MVFFYLPSDYWRTVNISINGHQYDSFYGNETDRIMNLGYYEADEFVEIRITLASDNLYVKQDVSYFYSINYDNLEKAIETLSASQLILDDRSTDDHLFGTISLPQDGQTVGIS